MIVAAASVLAASSDKVSAKVFDETTFATPANKKTKGIIDRFLGTGAADWNGPDNRGEHRRLSSILVDGHILVDFTPTDVEMLPKGCTPDTIFYTHSHGDHYHPATALKVGVKRVQLGQTWYNVAVSDFHNPVIDWNANNTYIQSEGINQDFGVYNSPDELLAEHHQEMSFVKKILFRCVGRHLMNRNVNSIRKS